MRKKLFAIALTLCASLLLSVSAFADDTQYKPGQDVAFSGHTDFGYYFTYTAGKTDFKCFSVVDNGQRKYAAVKANLYDYYKKVFDDKDVSLKGNFQKTADDGAPIIFAYWEVTNGGENLTRLEEYIAPVLYEKGSFPDLRLLYDLYDDSATVSIANDSSYITIDTNPYNISGGSILFSDLGLDHIKLTNKALGLPDWLYEEMLKTRALDGRQREAFEKVTVTWTYHPNYGLEVVYRMNR